MTKPFVLTIWVFSAGIAYWLGRSGLPDHYTNKDVGTLGEEPHEIDPRELVHDHFIEEPPININVPEGNRSPEEAVTRVYGSATSSSRLEPSLIGLQSSHPITRLRAFAELLETPSPQSMESALRTYESLPGGPGRFSELKMLAFAWGQVDPKAALIWAKKQQHWEEHLASSSILDSWARNDAEAAIRWAKENFEGKENPYFVGIINGLSESSLPKATDLMTELPYGRVRGRAAHILFEKVWSEGEDVAINWAEKLPAGSLQNFAFGELGEKVARSDMRRAVEWVDSMQESPIKSAVSEDVAREMARQNPNAAGDWVIQLPNGEAKEAGIKEVAKIWAKKDPAATAEWINQFPDDANVDSAIEALVRQITSTDPAGALSWAETMTNPDRRQKLILQAEKAIKAEKFPSGVSR